MSSCAQKVISKKQMIRSDTGKMDLNQSKHNVFLSEMKVTNEQDTLLKAYIEKSRHLERAEEELRALRMKWNRLETNQTPFND